MKAKVVLALAAILFASIILEEEQPGLMQKLACSLCHN